MVNGLNLYLQAMDGRMGGAARHLKEQRLLPIFVVIAARSAKRGQQNGTNVFPILCFRNWPILHKTL